MDPPSASLLAAPQVSEDEEDTEEEDFEDIYIEQPKEYAEGDRLDAVTCCSCSKAIGNLRTFGLPEAREYGGSAKKVCKKKRDKPLPTVHSLV